MPKMTDLIRAGELQGYRPGFPPRNPVSLVDGDDLDRDIAEQYPCVACGGKCEYRPYVAEQSHTAHFGGHQIYSYRSFAVCTVCDEAMEF
jgi:hypothetical protein